MIDLRSSTSLRKFAHAQGWPVLPALAAPFGRSGRPGWRDLAFESTNSLCDGRWREVKPPSSFRHRPVVDHGDEGFEEARVHTIQNISSEEMVVYILLAGEMLHDVNIRIADGGHFLQKERT